MDRRDFLRDIGIAGGVLLATGPWLSAFSEAKETANNKVRIGIIGSGSRGRYLMSFLAQNPKATIAAICDVYQPSIDEALTIAPQAKVYEDYRRLLEDRSIDGVIVATPLDRHYQIVMDAFDAGKHVFCEKAIGYTIEQSFLMYHRHLTSGKVFFIGQQRLFDPRYLKAMEMVHQGVFGDIEAIRTFWFRNNDWRRPVPSPELERSINWRLYKEYSRGLMTELACHQIQVGMWATRLIPNKVMGHGAITHWKDGREVDDNVSCIYVFDDGRKITFDSVISNKFYGLEEQILGSKGTIEPETGKYYFEEIPPAPAFLQLVNDIEHKIFDQVSFAGPSWVPETAGKNTGEYLLGSRPQGDGSSLLVDAYVEAVITGKQPPLIAEDGYYATALSLLGYQAIEEKQIITFPDEFKLNYLNHKNEGLIN